MKAAAQLVVFMVRILIVDDHSLIRRMVRDCLEDEADWFVCGESADGQEAVRQAETLQPQVIILDFQMPVMNGFDAARNILEVSPQILILIVSSHDGLVFAELSRKCGAKGFLAKHHVQEHLVGAIKTLLRGELHFPPIRVGKTA